MRRIVRRIDTLITVQTWTFTWVEEVPGSEPAPSEPLPALPPGPLPEATGTAPENTRPLPAPAGDAD